MTHSSDVYLKKKEKKNFEKKIKIKGATFTGRDRNNLLCQEGALLSLLLGLGLSMYGLLAHLFE